jgi:hypothetical protein
MVDNSFEKIAAVVVGSGAAAVVAAFMLAIAHYGLGLSRQEIRTPAVIAAAIIGLLLATEYFGKNPGKPE